jgi:hypothetical protein
MKKEYMKPQMEVIEIASTMQLLAGSIGANFQSDPTMAPLFDEEPEFQFEPSITPQFDEDSGALL